MDAIDYDLKFVLGELKEVQKKVILASVNEVLLQTQLCIDQKFTPLGLTQLREKSAGIQRAIRALAKIELELGNEAFKNLIG